jgi:hypothetical protein
MKRKTYNVAFIVAVAVVMAAFLSAIFFVNADLSFAAGKKKPSAVTRTSAVDYTEARIAQLQGALKITEAQQPLWNNLTQVMRDNAKDMDAITDDLHKEKAEGTKTLNAVEHMKFHSRITDAHADQLKKLIPPFEALYSSMSDEQKKSTDTIFRTGMFGKGKRK